jgi:predicted amidohydrolase YtcJ
LGRTLKPRLRLADSTELRRAARIWIGCARGIAQSVFRIHAAVTRQRADGSPSADGWYPEQKLTLAEALSAYTFGAAYAANAEDRLGKLSENYLADLIVLDEDPFEIAPANLLTMSPLLS